MELKLEAVQIKKMGEGKRERDHMQIQVEKKNFLFPIFFLLSFFSVVMKDVFMIMGCVH